jgi:hypothetical protein
LREYDSTHMDTSWQKHWYLNQEILLFPSKFQEHVRYWWNRVEVGTWNEELVIQTHPIIYQISMLECSYFSMLGSIVLGHGYLLFLHCLCKSFCEGSSFRCVIRNVFEASNPIHRRDWRLPLHLLQRLELWYCTN